MSRSTTERRVLSGRYRIEELLGHGGMGRVYRGTDLVLGRTVAVKILSEQLAHDLNAVKRFRREAQAAAGLNHPGIVAVFDTGSDGDVQYIVMEFVTGRTLAEILREEGALEPSVAAGVASAVAEALGHAHAKGIVHRDIKPANVMRTPSGDVKVMDFGIARAASSDTLTRTAAVVGTATYLAPEQARGDPVDARTDLYSLGVVLYEMLTARPPFVADSPVAVAYKHVREEPVPASRVNPRVDPALDGIVLRALAKDPGARYQTAGDLERDLKDFGETRGAGTVAQSASVPATQRIPVQETAPLPPAVPPAAVGQGPPSGPSRRPRRAGWMVALAALVVVLTAGLILAAISRGPTAREGPSPTATRAPSTGRSASSPTPPTRSPLSVPGALDRLGLLITQGVTDGSVSQHAAGEIAKGVREAVKSYQDGDLRKALDTLDELRGKVGDLEAKGEVTSGRGGQLRQAISDLEGSMQASPAASGDEGDGDGGG
jgi:serine/threonine-protein kinase